MGVTGRYNRVPAVEVQISLAVRCVDPDVFAAFDDEREFLVGCDLVLLFDFYEVLALWLTRQVSHSFP
jgi:hypothetical protein